TGQPLTKIQQDAERDYYMSGDEATKYGLVDRVLKRHENVDKGKL
ncbi:MAG TPA: ATP-dependent Clp protease proteolytic subunit, partial [Bdellovibrionota bacterium]